MSSPQVVITGAGLVSALGLDRAACWSAVMARHCGIRDLTALEQTLDPPARGGEAPGMEVPAGVPREVAGLQHALAEALGEAGLGDGVPYEKHRCGVLLGTTLAGMRSGGVFLRTGNPEDIRPFLATSTLRAATAGLGFTGPALTTSSACGSGLASMGLALSLLQAGELDLVISGGYDPLSEYAYAGFNSLRLVADTPPMPFSRDRTGMKLGEAYAIVVLERRRDAERRGARPIARLAGYGETSDAHHLTQPHPEGAGAARAATAALDRAGLTPASIGLITAHATSTPNNDGAEREALLRVFGDGLATTPVVGFKSYLGHTLGGAGAAELILTSFALDHRIHPATLNVTEETREFDDIAINTGAPRSIDVDATLGLSLGFGGANSCMVLQRGSDPTPDTADPAPRSRPVHITGVGVVAPGAVGNAAFIERLADDDGPAFIAGAVDDADLVSLVDARRTRRLSTFVKLLLAATRASTDDAGIEDVAGFAESCCAILGSAHGAADYTERYYDEVVTDGIAAANPMLFAEGVPNVGSAQLSLALGMKGPAQTIVGSHCAGLEALHLAALRIGTGEWDRAIVGAAEEHSPTIDRIYAHCGQHAPEAAAPGSAYAPNAAGYVTGAGAAVIILESADAMRARGGRSRGVVEHSVAGCCAGTEETIERVFRDIGTPSQLIGAGCATRGDAEERRALGRLEGDRFFTSMYGHLAQTFSVMPIAGIAAALLTGRLPRLVGSPPPAAGATASPGVPLRTFGVLARDPLGPLAAARIAPIDASERME